MSEQYIRLNGRARLESVFRRMQGSISNRGVMLEIGEFIRFRIQSRTAEGKSVDGTTFKPYSEGYRLFRQKTGRPVDRVNLFFTGFMMSSMAVDESSDSVKVYFQNSQAPGSSVRNPEKAFHLNKEREFFALSKEDIKEVQKIMENYYKQKIRLLT